MRPSFLRPVVHVLTLGLAGAPGLIAACGGGVSKTAPGSDAGPIDAPATSDAPASSDAPSTEAGPPACPSTCGPTASDSCCSSGFVGGGMFYRSYDGTSCDPLTQTCFNKETWPAIVTAFHLDRFEATIGRYRPFVSAVEGGWRPSAGAGKHTHLNGGQGVVDSSTAEAGVTYETGWDPSWDTLLEQSVAAPDAGACPTIQESDYTASPGPNENRPVSCVTWWAAYAFCIWDGGFLPTETEWNYAASGGNLQRVYPWGSQPIDCTLANFDYCLLTDAGLTATGTYVSVVGAYSPQGDGLFGQSDLEGNVSEWTLDYFADYVTPCTDCAYLQVSPAYGVERTLRGAAFDSAAPYVLPVVSERYGRTPDLPLSTGMRCARVP